jgi:hypothetical protein
VKTHQFIYTTRRGDQSTEAFEFRNDEMATICARSLLNPEIIFIGVRRNEDGGNTVRVGMWVWHRGQPKWKPNE